MPISSATEANLLLKTSSTMGVTCMALASVGRRAARADPGWRGARRRRQLSDRQGRKRTHTARRIQCPTGLGKMAAGWVLSGHGREMPRLFAGQATRVLLGFPKKGHAVSASLRLCLSGLLAVAILAMAACNTVKAPPMPQVPNPPPAPEADALEVERYQLTEEKRALEAQYGDHIDRIKQINARLIEINIELHRRGLP